MSAPDIAVLAAIAVALSAVIIFIVRKKKNGKSCGGCSGDCLNCNKNNK